MGHTSRAFVALISALLLSAATFGQDREQAPAQPDQAELIATLKSEIESELDQLDSADDQDTAAQSTIRNQLTTALQHVTDAQALAAEAEKFESMSEEAPDQLAAIRSELSSSPGELPNNDPGVSLAQLEVMLSEATAQLQAARSNASAIRSESAARTERRGMLASQISSARQRLADLNAMPIAQPREGESSANARARNLLRRAETLHAEQELAALTAEIASYDARRELLPARFDLAQRQEQLAQERVATLQSVVTERRKSEAADAALQAEILRNEAAQQHPVLQAYAEETAQRAASHAGSDSVTERVGRAARQISLQRSELETRRAQFASIQRRLDASGLNRATGLLLRRQYDTLPNEAELRRKIRTTEAELEDAEYALIELQEERVGAGNTDRLVQELMQQIAESGTPADGTDTESVARELVEARRDLLDRQIADTSSLFENLADLSTDLQLALTRTEGYRDFVAERIFWVRSISGDRLLQQSDIKDTARWAFDAESWRQVVHSTWEYLVEHFVFAALITIAILISYGIHFRVRRHLRVLGERVSSYRTDKFSYTLEAFALTAIAASPIALTIFGIGWLLTRPTEQHSIAQALGGGMQTAALSYYPFAFLRQSLMTRGLAEAHFRWSSVTLQPLRVNLRWFIPVLVPIELIAFGIFRAGDEAANASIGRLAFTAGLIALAVFMYRLLHPKSSIHKRIIDEKAGGWLYRFRHVWYPLSIFLPLAFIILSWTGFHYTAIQLETRLEQSLALALCLIMLNGVMLRWLFIARRRLAVEDAKRRREQAAAEEESKKTVGEPQPEAPPIDEDKLDLPALSLQTRQLFKAATTIAVAIGLYLIWAQALPALRMLDRVQIWPAVAITDSEAKPDVPFLTVNGSSSDSQSKNGNGSSSSGLSLTGNLPGLSDTSGSNETEADSESSEEPLKQFSITLAMLGLAAVILLTTYIAFRNLPSLIEIAVLQRLPLDSGSRYALSTVFRYFIAIVGLAIAFNSLGITWSKVQWLAAALTFGLAFGLQEIFANFISGLIILAERPVRLGDTVTVGGVTGTVSRIRMRATTIVDWDRKELIIPNKTFITGDVINWSLSDPILRLTIPVGVSYESDIGLVEKLLHKVAKRNKTVLDEPMPQVLFKQFGDSTLDFELRVFIPSIDHLIPIRHEMHKAIITTFRENDIEIAFPQRDLHVRSIGDLANLAAVKPDADQRQ